MDIEIKDMLVKLLEGQTRLETEVKKNSIILEAVQKKIDIIAEVQTSHSGKMKYHLWTQLQG